MDLNPGGIFAWIVVGIVAGWLAGTLTGTSHGLLGDLFLGLFGAFIGGVLFALLGIGGSAGFLGSIGVATLGAIVVLAISRAFTSRRSAF